jgi:hypothetical protein
MKAATVILMSLLVTCIALGEDIVVRKLHGDVSVRHGVTEIWTKVSVGDVLRPDDSMRTGKRGTAALAVASKIITLPGEVIVDLSDVRELSQEELMLKLAMERVRASSYEWKSNEMNIPNVTTVHGRNEAKSAPLTENNVQVGTFQLNGAKVLFANGFYSTCALKSMDVLRRYPPLAAKFANRLLVAQALEKANLHGEALNEYISLSSLESITPQQKEQLETRIVRLRQQTGGD